MKCFVSFVCVISFLSAAVIAAPLPQQAGIGISTGLQVGSSSASGSASGQNPLTSVLSNIDLPGLLRGVNSFVGLVRQFCPPLGQLLDNVIQNVTSTAFRVFGRAILQSGGLGGGSGGGGGGGGRVSVVLPTFPPDDEDYDEDEDESSNDASTPSSSSAAESFNGDFRIGDSKSSSSDTTMQTTEPNSELVSPAENTVDKRHVRVARAAAPEEEFEEEEEEDDQDGAESAPQPSEDLSNVDDQDRNKRYLPFGATVDAHGSTGGSGNFLFDIIRNTAGAAARTVGNVVQFVAGGAQNLGLGVTATEEQSRSIPVVQEPEPQILPQLVAGSGATEESDEKANSPGGVAEVDISGKGGAGYTEGIPGPITRLFVIANRGLANLVQDLILRLAQTSEKFVNFKARLVTSLI